MLSLGLAQQGLPVAFSCSQRPICLTRRAQVHAARPGSRCHQQLPSGSIARPGSSGSGSQTACCALPKLPPRAGGSSSSSGSRHQRYEADDDSDDELAADDNIFLLGSEDEEDVDVIDSSGTAAAGRLPARGMVMSGETSDEDFAAAMAVAARQALSGSSGEESDGGWGRAAGSSDGEDDWATLRSDSEDPERERVFLVGVTYKQQQQRQQQQQQQQQRSSVFARPRVAPSSAAAGGLRPRGGVSMAATSGSPWLAAAAAAAEADGSGSSGGAGGRRGRRAVAYSVRESLEELGRLADTAGLQVVGSSYQALEAPNNATYIGSGKVAEVCRAIEALQVDTVIFDDELSPGQLRNLEKAFSSSGGKERRQVAVADRTALILDIFSQRARTREGKLQVELAQTEYQLPRLTRMWTHLDRVAGGGQVKGAGEKQIEIDKRLLRDKAAALRRELQAVRTHRAAHRARRADAPVPVVALVGYTNAGKSTLLNTLTDAGVLAEDKLFATLDPTTRRVRLDGNLEVLFSDTVGFIQKLPTQLVAAFRATLEEIAAASVVLHVLDVSAPSAAAQCAAVLQVLEELGVQELPLVTAWNKVDALPDPAAVRALAASRPDTVAISGASGEGLEQLLAAIAGKLAEQMMEVEVLLPYSAGGLLDEMHKLGKVTNATYTEAGTQILAHVPRCLLGKLTPYMAAGSPGPDDDVLLAQAAISILDDGDNGQLSSSDVYDDDYVIDFDVDNRSYEDAIAAAAGGEAWQAAAQGAAAGGGSSSGSKSSYQKRVAGSRAGRREAQRRQQQSSLAQHQLPADFAEMLAGAAAHQQQVV